MPPDFDMGTFFGYSYVNGVYTPTAPPANLTFKVPIRTVSTYKSDSKWSTLASRIEAGGYDVIVNPNSNSKYYLCLNETGKLAYVTYANDLTRSFRSVLIKGNVEIASTYTYQGTTYTVCEIFDKSFYGAGSLQELVIPTTVLRIGNDIFGNNADGFRCYVPNQRAATLYNSFPYWSFSPTSMIYTYLRNDEATSQTFSPLVYPIKVPSEPAFYTVEDYNAATRTLRTHKLPESQAVKAGEGLLVTGMEIGKIYRLDKVATGYDAVGLLVGNGWNETTLNTTTDKQYYYNRTEFKALEPSQVQNYRSLHPGEALLNLNRVNVNDIDTFAVDLFTNQRGDVNGDGVVSGSDVTALYNVLLNGAVVDGNPDVNGDGVVSGTDVTSLYNILLGN